MDELLTFDILNETIDYDPDIKDFKEFCSNLDSIGVLVSPELYLEAMKNNNKTWKDKLKLEPPFKNTRKTTGDLKKAYNDVTDGGGTLIRAVWDASMKAIQLASRIVKFILLNLAKIPKMIIGLAKTIGKIPANVRNKVRGNINLYITVNDINNLFKTLIPLLDNFLRYANEMSKGDMWGTFFNRRPAGSKIPTKYIVTENDMGYYKKMKSYYEKVKLIEFEETTVLFENQNIVDIYFGGSKSIKYTDANGKSNESTYYDALIHIFNEIRDQDEFLKRVQTDMSEKFDRSQMNQSFGRLDDSAKNIVAESIQMVSKAVNIIGNLMRYTIMDIKTLRNSANKMLKKDNITRVKNESVHFTESRFSFDHKKEQKSYRLIDSIFDMIFGTHTSTLSKKKDPELEKDISPDGNDMELMQAVIDEFNELTKRNSISIDTKKPAGKLSRTQSKFGGTPYWPKGKPYPMDGEDPLVMIAQINCEEVPKGLQDFPTKGILQFFVNKYADYDGEYKVIYHDQILSDNKMLDEIPMTTDNWDEDETPFTGELELTMKLEEIYMTIYDYRFEDTFMPIFNKHFKTDIKDYYWGIKSEKIKDLIYKNYSQSGSRIDGYPFFTQEDIRHSGNPGYEFLLLQIDTDNNINWGDCGVANFFTSEKAVKSRKFDKVMYSWDCY